MRHAELEPVVEDDATIAAALEETTAVVLAAATACLTGDASILREIRPRRIPPVYPDLGLDDDQRAVLRRRALDAIAAFRDGGCVLPPSPAPDVLREVMDWLAGEDVGEYTELLAEEMDLDGVDPRRLRVHGDPAAISVLVIGCGMSGLLAGVRLQQAGIPYEIVDKNADVGGTWYENTYPGCRVDVGNHFYCYSFEPNHGFSHLYSEQPELHGYFRDVLRRHGVEEHVRWATEVERAEWDDASRRWLVTLRDSGGHVERRAVTAVISAVGQLNRPHVPDLPGLDRFAGPVFHSARWDHGVDLRGRRVGLVGAGASGFQIGPAIVDDVDELVVFQRTAQWMVPNPRYHEPVAPGELWAMRHVPGYARWYRFLVLWQSSDRMLEVARVDPDWPDLPRSANRRSASFRDLALQWMASQVDDDAELLAKVVPDYPPLGKRMLQDDGSWLGCLRRDHVELVRDEIDGIDEHGVVAGDRRFDLDVLVLATGFRANDFLFPMEVVGRGGVRLHERWAGRPAAYVGITVPGFPNLFMLYGPGTNLAHAGSIVFHSECQMRYIGASLDALVQQGGGSIEPTEAAFDEYVARWQAELATTVWAHPSVTHSWYKAADGHVYVLSPWRLVDYWRMTAGPDPACHALRPP
jgi:4-hydroxyacetophenone monooxygenase